MIAKLTSIGCEQFQTDAVIQNMRTRFF